MRRSGIIMSITGDRHDIQRVNISALCRVKKVMFFFFRILHRNKITRKGKRPEDLRITFSHAWNILSPIRCELKISTFIYYALVFVFILSVARNT